MKTMIYVAYQYGADGQLIIGMISTGHDPVLDYAMSNQYLIACLDDGEENPEFADFGG